MKHRQIVIISFGILLFIAVAATILTVLNSDAQYSSLIYAIVMVYGVGVEVAVLLFSGLFYLLKGRIVRRDTGKMPIKDEAWQARQNKQREMGKIFLLSAGLVLLVGFSACLGGSYLLTEIL